MLINYATELTMLMTLSCLSRKHSILIQFNTFEDLPGISVQHQQDYLLQITLLSGQGQAKTVVAQVLIWCPYSGRSCSSFC